MRVLACTPPREQSQVLRTLKRDMLRYRRTLRDRLASDVATNVRHYRVVDDHFKIQRQEMIQAASAQKEQLEDKHEYYANRGALAMDMVYSTISFQLYQLELELRMEVEQLKRHNTRMMEDLAALEHRMNVQRSQCHFFKSLYERDPSKPVGESLDMLRDS